MLGGLSARRVIPVEYNALIVDIVSWVLLALTIFTLLTRLALKLALSRKAYKFGLDDIAIVLAGLFSIGETVSASAQASQVLGRHVTELSPSQRNHFQSTDYASVILYIANLTASRISIALFIRDTLAGTLRKKLCFGTAILSLVWGLVSVLAAAFPCAAPRVWAFRGKNCYDRGRFLNYIGASNIILESLLVSLPLIFWNIRVSWGRTLAIFFGFSARFTVIACMVPLLVFYNCERYSPDYTYKYWRVVLCAQIAQNLSVITACLPCLNPFLLELQSGKVRPDDLRIHHRNERCIEKNFDATNSASSTSPLKETHYVAPLATYGLDESSTDLPAGDVFNRSIDYPRAPPTPSSSSQVPLPGEPPKTLAQVGFLPTVDWDSESDKQSSGGRSTPTRGRRPNSDYIFQREKVISVPEANKLYEGASKSGEGVIHHEVSKSWS